MHSSHLSFRSGLGQVQLKNPPSTTSLFKPCTSLSPRFQVSWVVTWALHFQHEALWLHTSTSSTIQPWLNRETKRPRLFAPHMHRCSSFNCCACFATRRSELSGHFFCERGGDPLVKPQKSPASTKNILKFKPSRPG